MAYTLSANPDFSMVDLNILQTIRNLMETLKLSEEETMVAIKISEADRVKYIAKL